VKREQGRGKSEEENRRRGVIMKARIGRTGTGLASTDLFALPSSLFPLVEVDVD
jgi:hypothetical protein